MKKIALLSILFPLALALSAQNVGVGIATPGTKLDVNGALTLREGSLLIATGAATGVIPTGYSQVLVTGSPSGAFTLTGLTGASAPANAGQKLVIYNNTTGGYTGTFASTAIPNGTAIEFIYSNSTWVATSTAASGSGSYIQNTTTTQPSSNYNISGNGTIGGNLNVTGTSMLGVLTQAGAANINTTGAAATNIGTSSTANTVTIGSTTGTSQVNITGGTTGSANVNANAGASSTNIGTGSTTGGVVVGAPANAINLKGTTTIGVPSSATGTLIMDNATNANTVTITSGVTSPSSYTLTLPTAVGTTGQALAATNGTGTLGWVTPLTSATGVSSITSTSPLTANTNATGAVTVNLTGVVGSTNGGTGVNNAGTLTNASNTTITGGGTLGLGGFTLTVPATGTAALGTGTSGYNAYWNGANTLTGEQYTNVTRGGTGVGTLASNGILYGNGTGAVQVTAASSAAGQILQTAASGGVPSWVTPSSIAVTSITSASPLTTNTSATGAVTVNLTGIVPSANGGTGINNGSNTLTIPASGTAALGTGTTGYSAYWSGANTVAAEQYLATSRGGMGASMTAGAIGAIPYATSTTAYGTLADVSAGSYLRSGGAGAAPLWSTLTLPNAATTGDILYASGTNAIGNLAAVAAGSVLTSNGTGAAPVWSSNNGLNWTLKGNGSISQPAVPTTYGTSTFGPTENFLGNTDAKDLTFGTTNLERMRILSSGNVGIGTAAPGSPLTVRATTATANARTASLGNAIGDPLFELAVSRGATTNSAVDVTTQIGQAYNGGTISEGIKFIRNSSATNGAMAFMTNAGTERMRIDNAGNVGIGTSSPTAWLHINSTDTANMLGNIYTLGENYYLGSSNRNQYFNKGTLMSITASSNNKSNTAALIDFNAYNSAGGATNIFLGAAAGGSGNGPANFVVGRRTGTTSWAESMRIDGNGNVGIGTASPNGLLEVKKTTQLQSNLILSGQEYYNSGNTNTGISLTIGVNRSSNKQLWIMDQDNVATQNSTNPVLRMSANGVPSIDAIATNGTTVLNLALCPGGGKVGIGTSTPARALEVNNALKLSNSSSDANDGVIGSATFAPGLDIVGINTDGTYRKIAMWGGITQQQNDLGNTFLNTSYFNGYVGIGNSGPGYPLEINSSVGWTGYNRWYSNAYLLSWSGWSSSSTNLGIYCHPSIATDNYFVSVSDRRTKKDMTISHSAEDLTLINKIEITDYKFIDTLGKGNRPFKKVIAQQVEAVYPQAVSTIKGIIPNIYTPAKQVLKDGKYITLIMDKAHGLKEGDKVSIYDGAWNQQEKEVCYADEKTFIVEIENAKDEYFVYGKVIDDLKSVDYDAISMLNVSATQELAKQLKAEKEKNLLLEQKLSELQSKSNATQSDVDKLKASIETLQQIVGAKAQK